MQKNSTEKKTAKLGPFFNPATIASSKTASYLRPSFEYAQKAWTVLMLENMSSASRPARDCMDMMLVSWFASMTAQTKVTMIMAGTVPRMINVSFHWTVKATTKPATNVDSAWMVRPSFSEMPWLTMFALVVTWPEMDPASERSKKAISWRRACLRKSTRSALVTRMAFVEMSVFRVGVMSVTSMLAAITMSYQW